MRKELGIVFIIFGIIGLLGSLVAGYINLSVGEALSLISTDTGVPAGTDPATLQQQAQYVSTVLMVAWVWIISVIIASLGSVYFGVTTLRTKRSSRV
jgi:hypothetical protein